MMQKVVLKLELHDDKTRRKAIKTASNVSGVESISIDSKDNKLTVTGDFDPVCLVSKLRKKLSHADIHSVGPAKEEKKKEEPKKEEQKKEGPKEDDIAKLVKAYQAYNPYMTTHYCVYSAEENPNACVIC